MLRHSIYSVRIRRRSMRSHRHPRDRERQGRQIPDRRHPPRRRHHRHHILFRLGRRDYRNSRQILWTLAENIVVAQDTSPNRSHRGSIDGTSRTTWRLSSRIASRFTLRGHAGAGQGIGAEAIEKKSCGCGQLYQDLRCRGSLRGHRKQEAIPHHQPGRWLVDRRPRRSQHLPPQG